jgi:hypothetical protein
VLLQAGGWLPLFASSFVLSQMSSEFAASVAARLPLPAGAIEISLWLEKR